MLQDDLFLFFGGGFGDQVAGTVNVYAIHVNTVLAERVQEHITTMLVVVFT
jgi:hypothetical protein